MSILPIKYDYCLCEPFCDYLNITTPKGNSEALLSDLRPMLDSLGALEVSEGLFALGSKLGTFKVHPRSQVMVFGASGGFLEALRRQGLYGEYLSAFFNYEHRISMMHATVDYRVDAAEYVDAIYRLGTSGNCYLTRKSINPMHVSRLTGQNLEGFDTGTVYLGNRQNSDVWAKAYDKRQERLAKGFDDCGPMLRLEIAVQSDVGATLRDASKPHDLFYHFASRSLVEPPPNLVPWVSHGEGFAIEKRKDNFTTWEQIRGIMDNSPDVGRMIALASEYGDDALIELTKLLRNRVLQAQRSKLS